MPPPGATHQSVMTILRIVIPFYDFCLSMIFSENRYPLCANAALRVRIMLALSLILCAFDVRPVFRHYHDACPGGHMWGNCRAHAVGEDGGLVG